MSLKPITWCSEERSLYIPADHFPKYAAVFLSRFHSYLLSLVGNRLRSLHDFIHVVKLGVVFLFFYRFLVFQAFLTRPLMAPRQDCVTW